MMNKKTPLWKITLILLIFLSQPVLSASMNYRLSAFSQQINPYDLTCFAAGTLITMADGKTKVIENIRKGDKVLSFNENTKELESKTVLNAFRKDTKKIVEIKLANTNKKFLLFP